MTELTEKFLQSGLIDRHTAQLMERWGTLPPGSAEKVGDELKGATREQLEQFAEEVAAEVDKRRRAREQMLDLNQLRWPASVDIFSATDREPFVTGVAAVLDVMGRYYFRPQDVKKEWLIPGFRLRRFAPTAKNYVICETILEVSELNIGEKVAAVQVTTDPG